MGLIAALVLVLQDPAPLIERLHSDDLDTRESAQRELVKLGESALPALRKAHEAERDVEAKGRLAAVIAKIEKPIRYGRTAGGWTLRLEAVASLPIKRIAFAELGADGSGAAAGWTGDGLYAITATKEQVDEAIDLAIAADLLDADFSAVETAEPGSSEAVFLLTFRCGKSDRTIRIASRTIPEELRKLRYLLLGALTNPVKKFQGREIGGLIRELSGTAEQAAPAEKAIRRLGAAGVPHLKKALEEKRDDVSGARIRALLAELEKR